jgi:hypothetical protein
MAPIKARSSAVGFRRPAILLISLGAWQCISKISTGTQSFVELFARPRGSATSLHALGQVSTEITIQELLKLKEKLYKMPSKATISALEQLGNTDDVLHTEQLEGKWRLLSPKENGAVGWVNGDLPRILLDLYIGNIGRMLSMNLAEPPQLSIARNGQTETKTQLRWGSQQDEILMQVRLEVRGPNVIRETPLAIKSAALKLTLPAVQGPRDLRVTYFDGDLLIVRDSRGIVDALWREQATSKSRPAGKSNSFDAASRGLPKVQSGVKLEGKVSAESSPTAQMGNLLSSVEVLRESLEAQQKRIQEEHEARLQLTAEAARLEKQFEAAKLNARADSVKLSAIARIQGKASDDTELQSQKAAQRVHDRDALEAEVQGLRIRATEFQTDISRYQLQESSLRAQILMLEKELITGARDAWPAYRTAVAKARDELQEVQGQLKTANKEVSQLQKELSQRSVELKRKTEAAEIESAVRLKLEEQLAEQQREVRQASESLAQAVETEQALRLELSELREKLLVLEEREVESKRVAAELQEEISTVANQVKAAKEVVKNLGKQNEKRRFWPFR